MLRDVIMTMMKPAAVSGPALWSWGQNSHGQLFVGDTTNRSSPVQVGSLTNWSMLSGGRNDIIAIKTNGTLWGAGSNSYKEIGSGSTYSSPVQIGSATTWSNICLPGAGSLYGIQSDGTLWSWGGNSYGQLGQGDRTNRSTPTKVGALTNWKMLTTGQNGFGGSVLAIKTDGTLWAWGQNAYVGELGLGDLINRSSPVQVGALTNWSSVTIGGSGAFPAVAAIKTDGTLWSWGSNSYSWMGPNSAYSSPVQVGSLTTWKQIAMSGSRTALLGIKTDGTLWAVGDNADGLLGNSGSTGSVSTFVQVGSATNWKSISCGEDHAIGLKTDGTLWSWGENSYGQLGNSDSSGTTQSSPVRVGSLTTWSYGTTGYNQGFGLHT